MFVRKCKAIVKIFWIFGRGILRNQPSFLTAALLETVTSSVVSSRKNRELGDVRRICPLQIQNNFQNRIVFPNKHQIQHASTTLFFSLFETVNGSGKKTLAILWYAQAWRIRQLFLAIKKHRIFSLGLKEAFCCSSINIFNCRCKRKCCRFYSILQYAQALVPGISSIQDLARLPGIQPRQHPKKFSTGQKTLDPREQISKDQYQFSKGGFAHRQI